MILRRKARNQFLFLVLKSKQECNCRAKNLALTLWWQLTNKISCTQYHHKLIFYSSCHVPRRVLGCGTKVEPGTIRVVGERILAINGAVIATTVTQRGSWCRYWRYLFLFHWIIQSSIHLRCRQFVNTPRAMSCRHQWYLSFPHGIRYHWWRQLIALGVLTNRQHLRWIDDWIIQWKINRYRC